MPSSGCASVTRRRGCTASFADAPISARKASASVYAPMSACGPLSRHLAGHRVGEGVGSPAEERTALEERDARAAARQADRRGQAREAAAHDDDVAVAHPASQ